MRVGMGSNSVLMRAIVIAGSMAIIYYLLVQITSGSELEIVLLVALVYSGMVILNPRLGLYSLCVSLLLIPSGFLDSVTRPLSPNLAVMVAATWAWGMSAVLSRLIIRSTALYIPCAVAGAVTWIGLVRYGSQFYNVPLIFTESMVLFVLTFHLLRDRTHIRRLLMVLVIAFLVRNAIDIGQTIYSLQTGSIYGAIRDDALLFGGTSTSQSDLRALVLPLLIIGVAYAPNLPSRIVIGISLVLDVVWLGLAGTRTGVIGLTVALLSTVVLLPRSKQRWTVLLAVPMGVLALLVATQLSEAGPHVSERTQIDLDLGFGGGRAASWADAFNAFAASPLIGSGMGASHSYMLGAGRTMGLAFLLPFFAGLLIITSHCAWLRKTRYDQEGYAIASGVVGMLIVVFVLSFTGTMLQGLSSFVFWMLVGVVESIYLTARVQRAVVDKVPEQRTDPASAGAGEPWQG